MSVMNNIIAEEGVAEYWLEKKAEREKAEEFARAFWEETDRIKEEKKRAEERQRIQKKLNKACSTIESFVYLYFSDDIDAGNNFMYDIINNGMSVIVALSKYNISLLFDEKISDLENEFYVCQMNRHIPYIKSRKNLYRLEITR